MKNRKKALFFRKNKEEFMILLFILKTILLLIGTFFLVGYTAERMRIRYPAGSIPVLTILLPLLSWIPYVGWILAALFLLRFTAVMSNKRFWPEALALGIVVIPILMLLEYILFELF